MKLSEIKNEGYAGLDIHCARCRRLAQVKFEDLPDGEFIDVADKLRCERCGEKPGSVTSYRNDSPSPQIGHLLKP